MVGGKSRAGRRGRLAAWLVVGVISTGMATGCRCGKGIPPPVGRPPAEAQDPSAWTFFVLGDTRSYPEELRKTIQSLSSFDPRAKALFNTGDLTAKGLEAEWVAHQQALAQGAPDPFAPIDPGGVERRSRVRTDATDFGDFIRYFGIMGNHDTGSEGWLGRWNRYLPGQRRLGQNSEGGIYFSLTYRNALFIALDSHHPSEAQTRWLAQTLDSPEARAATWKLAFFHDPVYPCNGKPPFKQGLDWVTLFEEHGVDIAFVAHSHTFERTCPMKGGKCAASGVVYLNSSAAAVDPRDIDPRRTATVELGDRAETYRCEEILQKARGRWRHFCHVKIGAAQLRGSCRDHDNPANVYDEFTLRK